VGILGAADGGPWWVAAVQEYEAAARARIAIRGFFPHAKRPAARAIQRRLPSMYEDSSVVEAGGLVSYTSHDAENYGRAAVYVDKILRRAKPADLPSEEPTTFELVINLKTAEQLGLAISPAPLFQATKVIR
jgi:putative tryptophan/tyrosine transport system substrate-binding protein